MAQGSDIKEGDARAEQVASHITNLLIRSGVAEQLFENGALEVAPGEDARQVLQEHITYMIWDLEENVYPDSLYLNGFYKQLDDSIQNFDTYEELNSLTQDDMLAKIDTVFESFGTSLDEGYENLVVLDDNGELIDTGEVSWFGFVVYQKPTPSDVASQILTQSNLDFIDAAQEARDNTPEIEYGDLPDVGSWNYTPGQAQQQAVAPEPEQGATPDVAGDTGDTADIADDDSPDIDPTPPIPGSDFPVQNPNADWGGPPPESPVQEVAPDTDVTDPEPEAPAAAVTPEPEPSQGSGDSFFEDTSPASPDEAQATAALIVETISQFPNMQELFGTDDDLQTMIEERIKSEFIRQEITPQQIDIIKDIIGAVGDNPIILRVDGDFTSFDVFAETIFLNQDLINDVISRADLEPENQENVALFMAEMENIYYAGRIYDALLETGVADGSNITEDSLKEMVADMVYNSADRFNLNPDIIDGGEISKSQALDDLLNQIVANYEDPSSLEPFLNMVEERGLSAHLDDESKGIYNQLRSAAGLDKISHSIETGVDPEALAAASNLIDSGVIPASENAIQTAGGDSSSRGIV